MTIETISGQTKVVSQHLGTDWRAISYDTALSSNPSYQSLSAWIWTSDLSDYCSRVWPHYCTQVQIPLQLNSEDIGINLSHKKLFLKSIILLAIKNIILKRCKCVCAYVCVCVCWGDYSTELSIMHQQKSVSAAVNVECGFLHWPVSHVLSYNISLIWRL